MEKGYIELGLSRLTAAGMGDISELTARHAGIPGFDQSALDRARVALVGAGGLMGEIGEGLARKGAKHLAIYDGDKVEPSNLSRQRFYANDLWKNKAIALANNLAVEAINKIEITAGPMHFQVALKRGLVERPDLILCGVDNNPGRVAVSRYCVQEHIPTVFVAVTQDADSGYVFVQKPGEACFGCLFPHVVDDRTTPCPDTPAVKNILKVVAGFVLYAVDTVLMQCRRDWNYRLVFLSSNFDQAMSVPSRSDCRICGPKSFPPKEE